MIKRKGFTLLEVIVTISILGICFALTIGVVAALTNIQKASSSNVSLNSQVDKVDATAKEFVSLVSINTSAKSYTPETSPNDYEVIFSKNETKYYLRYLDSRVGIYEDSSTLVEYEVDDIKDVKFEYTASLALLIASVQTSNTTYKFAYTVRTML